MTAPSREHLLQRFADQTKDMIYCCRVSPTRKWEYLSPSCARLTGYTVEEHLADPMLAMRVVHPDDHGLYARLLDDKSRNEDTIVVRWIRKDGTQLWIEEQVRFVRDEAGTVLAVEGIARDVTERKRAEAQLAEAQRIAQLGSWEWSIDRDEMSWSEEMHRIHGTTPGAAPKSFAEFQQTVAPEDRERVEEVLRRALAERRPFSHELRIVRPSGEIRQLQVRGEAFFDPEGRAVRVAGTALDVTERKNLEARLLVADRIASLGILAGGIAHEVNNPLTILSAGVEILAREIHGATELARDRAARIDELLASLRYGLERIARIVGDLKLYSRGDSETVGPVDLRRVMTLAADLTRNEVRHRARLVVDLASDLPPVEGNEFRLNQVFVNLIVNAAQAIRDGGADENEVRVVGRLTADGRIRVDVRDTGPGIPASLQHRIFEPFFTTKPIGAGTGLGLSICHTLVTSMGGEIRVESVVGKGSTFRVLLRASASALPTAREAQPTQALGPVSLLIVDDEPLVASTLARLLQSSEVTVSTANGRAALERLAAGERFDVIFCDVMMPDVSGIDVFETVTRSAPDQARRIVFMSGGAFVDRAVEFLRGVPNLRIDKPFGQGEARRAIDRVLAAEGRRRG